MQARSVFAATIRQEWVCPSLPDVVHLFGRVKPGRAWGEDLLHPDLVRCFQQELGQLFHPLFVKALMALEEPVQWRGGNLVFFPKKHSPNHSCNAHREIAESSVPGKLLHRRRHALVMPGLLDIAAETQCGGSAGRATDVASHLLRQTVEDHRAPTRSTIVVFVDVIAVFYNVVRSLVTDISPLLQDARLMDDESGMPSALAATSLDEHVLNSVTAQLVATWFSIVGSDTVSKFHRGVMPGYPEADQQFTLVISMLVNTLRAQLAIEGIEASIPHVPSDEAILSARRAAPVTWNVDVSYLYDIAIAIPVHADQAINTLRRTVLVLRRVCFDNFGYLSIFLLEKPRH